MNVSLQNRINPPVRPLEASTETKSGTAVDRGGGDKVDFGTVLGASNYETGQERKAKKNGDFSGAKTDQELFEALNQSTDKKTYPKSELDKDDFMKLFIAQLQNQDPLKPKEDYEMAAHLAQFNGLEQMLNVNKKLEELADLQKFGQSVGMIDYIGKEVNIEGGKAKLENGKPIGMKFNITEAVPNTKLQVRDASGKALAEVELGARAPGQYTINDVIKNSEGETLADAVYSFSLSSLAEDGSIQDIPVSTSVSVQGISLKGGDGKMFTNVGEVSSQDISAVGVAGFDRNNIQEKNKPEEGKEVLEADSKKQNLEFNDAQNSQAVETKETVPKEAPTEKKQFLTQKTASEASGV